MENNVEYIIQAEGLRFLDFIEYPVIQIKPQRATFLCGESGCGKSTFLQLINGVLTANQGLILYQGKNIMDYDPIELRKEILLCSQTVYLFDQTILENFHEYYDYRELPHLSEEEIREYLHICQLDFPLDTLCTTMSGGERHRVFLAICLSFLPKVLMLDEPTAALDDGNANELMKRMKEFCKKKGITLLIVCHDQVLAMKYADEMIRLERRRLA